ncbi:LysR substrate-binding domain-containing protein [Salirhabdus salicampi]|nr:LysR substrate-binding domain-containing protein [Salirhabdus salicampi]
MKGVNIAAKMGSTEAVIAAVEANMGISVISSLAVEKAIQNRNVKAFQLKDFNVSRTFYVSCLRDNINLPPVSSFLSFIKKC